MNTRKAMALWRSGLMMALLCICTIPSLVGAGTVPQIPIGPKDASGNWSVPDYYTTANWANSPQLAKFVDTLPGLGPLKANTLGNYIPVAVPDITSYPGSDYYEIELVEYGQQMHSGLPASGTKLRGYVQVNRGTNLKAATLPSQGLCGNDGHACTSADTDLARVANPKAYYLGPTIVSERNRPVRIKFTNKLPTGVDGDLFIPVDTSVMGAGEGPLGPAGGLYTQNRAAIHLHGGRTPWISDGTPHQWITPAGELTNYPKGVSLQNVPDMPDPGSGSTTYYYTNQQSARLMFYHDHAFGITRLNVYAGMAAGYVITDEFEQALVTNGLVPPDAIPLIIQDKTFVDATPSTRNLYNPVTGKFDILVPGVPAVRVTDPLWNWGSGVVTNGVREPVTGDLWMSHVYMPAQNTVAGMGGVNPFGRWMYGPWFYPATAVEKGPVANIYYDQDCSSPIPAVYANCTTPGQPMQVPGTPHPSMGMEAFQDTAVVNGTAFPSLTVDPRAYRFRILNAASDRFQNLSFYVADTSRPSLAPGVQSPFTEVKTVPASATLALAGNWPPNWPVDGRDGGVPDPGTCTTIAGKLSCPNLGPSFLQIANEGGFLPKPVTIDPQPITYNIDPTAFWVGNVDKMGLALGPAERADVIVDFSAYAGQTLILYNDAPAAWPARVAGYDYYTDAPDLRDSGGYGTGGIFNDITGFWDGGTGPLPGYGPNTRTVMQVIVRPAGPPVDAPYTFNEAALQAEFVPALITTPGLFEKAQEPIIVGQQAYKDVYPNSYFPPNYPWEGVNQVNDQFLQFVTLAGQPVRITTEPKGIHDEMGASFDPVYGRMSGNLAMQLPNPTTLNALLILYGFSDLPTETINNSPTVNVQVLGSGTDPLPWSVTDGTQIWKISHNGVDTHPIHFHIFDVQLINRVGWDGQILLPEPNELGWKDTVKISPLEDTIVAVRPRAPALPFGIANSLRPLNPAIPIGSGMGFNSVDWQTGEAVIPPVTNILYDFGWEYVWHCHILNHEEMDMMRPIVLKVPSTIPDAPTAPAVSQVPTGLTVTWTDPTLIDYTNPATFGNPKNEIGFRVERAAVSGGVPGPFAAIGTALANAVSYTDTTIPATGEYAYQIIAWNAAGDSPPSASVTGTMSATVPGAPVIGTATAENASATVTFTPPASDGGSAITLYTVTSASTNPANAVKTATGTASPITVTGLTNGQTYTFTVTATNVAGTGPASAPSNAVIPFTLPGAPTAVAATVDNAQTSVSFTAPLSDGGNAITLYTVTAAPPTGPSITATGTVSPIMVAGLTNGTSYAVTVTATNAAGVGPASSPAVNVTPNVVPNAPTAATAVGGNAQATISFTAPVANGGTPVLSYTVTSSPGNFTATGAASPITVTGLANGTAYTFTVIATNALGNSLPSAASNSVTPNVVPNAPTAVTAVAGNAVATVTFTAPAANGGTPVLSYTVTSNPGNISVTGAGSPLTVTGLTNNTTYTFNVVATNAAGNSLPATSNPVTPTSTRPASPTGLVAVASVPTINPPTVTLTWVDNSNNEASFQIQRATNAFFTAGLTSFTVTANITRYTDTTVVGNTRYWYRVRAVNGVGVSGFSNTVSLTPGQLPLGPTNLTFVSATASSITMSWTDNANNERGFYVERSNAPDPLGVWSRVATVAAKTTAAPSTVTFTNSLLRRGTQYFYRVRAYNNAGVSTYSNVMSGVTLP